jgi:hypothetical protein
MAYLFVPRFAMIVVFVLAFVVGIGEFYTTQYMGYVLMDVAGWIMIGTGSFLFILDIMLYQTKTGHGHFTITSHVLHILLALFGVFIALRRDLWQNDSLLALFAIGFYAIIFLYHAFTGHHDHHRQRKYDQIA